MRPGRRLLAGVLLPVATAAALSACAVRLSRIDTSCDLFPDAAHCAPGSVADTLLPGSGRDSDEYESRFLALLAEDRLGRLDRANGTGPFGRSFRDVANRDFQAEYRALARIVEQTPPPNSPSRGNSPAGVGAFVEKWRTARSTLYVDSDNPASGEFHFSGLQARSVEIVIRQVGAEPLDISGSCDGPIALARPATDAIVGSDQPFRLRLGAAGGATEQVRLYPAPELQGCELELISPSSGTGRIRVRREETADPKLAAMDTLYQRCPVPDPSGLTALEQVFLAGSWLSQTCPFQLGDSDLLADSRLAFNAKVEALSGTRLPPEFFDRGDPEAPIDMTRAPELSLIYFSYLDFKADFSGRVMERLLRHHAARGTKVRIMVTRVLERDKDRALLEQLAADFPNVQLQLFSWNPAGGAPAGEQASRFYKTHHVKMLATLGPNPAHSRAIIGGRNIHDGFLFHEPVDLTRYPNLHQYGRTDGLSLNYYSNWHDFELSVSRPETVRILAAHLATLWHRDAETDLSRPFSVPGKPVRNLPAGANARHFMSVPYADGRALETYFVELIDAAQHSIEIVNPYLNLTPRLAEAFDRALDRKVRITIVGRINMRGDLGGKFLTALNELFVERYGDRLTMFEYRKPDVVLHSKILMIDGRYVSVSSVNFNQRSFFHDSENGIAVMDAAFYRRMRHVFDAYVAQSRPVDPDVDIPFFYRLIFSSPLVLEAF